MDFRKRYFSHVLTTDIGPLTLIADGEALVAVRFENEEGSPRSSALRAILRAASVAVASPALRSGAGALC